MLDQNTRASGSVALNLAERLGRRGKDKRHHYAIAYGSAQETLSALRILVAVHAVDFDSAAQLAANIDRVCAMTWRLVHISELANRFIQSPHEVVQAGQRIQVKVIEVDVQQKRISLSAK